MTHTRTTYNSKTCSALRLLLLLLMMVGATGAQGQYFLTEQTYEGSSPAPTCDWVSDNTGRYTTAIAEESDNHYIAVSAVGTGNNGTRVYTPMTNVVTAGVSYILQFDIKIKGGDNQPSWFQVDDATNTAANPNGAASLSTSVLMLEQTTAGGTTWRVNGNSTQEVILDNSKWYTIRLHKTADKTFLTITDRDASTVLTGFNDVEITTNSTAGGLGNMEFVTKRYNSSLAIDNVSVQKWGWDVIGHTVNLTATNNDNKITSGMPTLYNPTSGTATYSYDGTVIPNYDQTYPPRLKTTGEGTVTATIGGKISTYTLYVNSPTGGGTYDPATKTYTFDNVGIVTNRSISDVPGITMSFRGGPTALVVDRNGSKYLKVIDVNGYSHPNLNNGASTIPPENNWGGTFYKFVPSANGTLSITGTFDSMKLYESNGTTLITSASSGTTATNISLEMGKTYYLYNAGSDGHGSTTPLLHSFSFTPNASSLTFRNPQPVITVDINEGSYTNPAISAQGFPVSYEITSGSSYASIDPATGKVTFNANLTEPSYSITVKATDGSEAISYTLNLARKTWIFDDNSKWTTTSTQLGTNWDKNLNYTGNGLNGTTFCREKNAYDYSELIMSGTTVLPETRGLLFSKVASNDRLYIAPKDYSPNFLAMRATFIAIDDVQAGQTVTVDWYGGNSSAVLDISDAAGENVRGTKRGPTAITATQTGRVTISSNAIVSYIRSIKVSTPTRAIGTLTYAKTVLSGTNTQTLTSYTITDETGATDLSSAYYAPQYFSSSNPSVVSVDANTGQIEAHSTAGVAVITAIATAKNSATHQETVTLVATVEVVDNNKTRIRTISIEEMLYTTGGYGSSYNRIIPGFNVNFSGNVTYNASGELVLSGSDGTITIEPRVRGEETVKITKALLTVNSSSGGSILVNDSATAINVSAGGLTIDKGVNRNVLTLKVNSGSISISNVKVYYWCKTEDNADYCLDETKLAPVIEFQASNFQTTAKHVMRVPGDGRSFAFTPVVYQPFSVDLSYIYTSSAPAIATINSDGTNGQLVASGQATITAEFHETPYFAATSATYTVSNTLLPGEHYDGISIAASQKIHIEASASAANTNLTLSGTATSTLTYGTTAERRNTYANSGGTVTLSNGTDKNITIYSVHVVTSILRQWLYYAGQEENYLEQVQFNSFNTGAIAGFRIIDIGDRENPIDLTDAYTLSSGSFTVGNASVLSGLDSSTGSATAATGATTISHDIVKTGQADGYADTYAITSNVTVFEFDATHNVVWSFINNIANVDNTLGDGWTWDDRGFHYGYFADYMPITNSGGSVYAPTDAKQMHGMMLKDEFRWYAAETTRGLRANLSAPNASIKFPVKAGMEIDIEVATSSADITHTISNVTDINGDATTGLEIQNAGWANNIHAYYLAASDGCVEIQSTDKVGMYLKSITLKIPEIHFTDDIVTVLNTASSTVKNATTNVPTASLQYLNYEILSGYSFDADGNEEALANVSTMASIDNTANSPTKGVVTLTGTEGWITVKVTNTNPNPNNLEPREGTYKLYAVDFRFDLKPSDYNYLTDENQTHTNYEPGDGPTRFTLKLDKNYNKEMDFSVRPKGINKVETPINYSFEIPSGSYAKAILTQATNPDPALTTYLLTAYNKGTIIVKATTGRIETTCTLNVTGHTFPKVIDVLSESDIEKNSDVYTIGLPNDYYAGGDWTLTAAFEGEFYSTPNITVDIPKSLNISNLYGNEATGKRNHGAIRVIATHNNWTPSDPSDDNYTQFVLTLAYPASSGKKWDFYRSTTGLKAQTDHDNKIGDYVGTHLNPQTVSSYTISGTSGKTSDCSTDEHNNTIWTSGWTTDATWNKIYRNGDKEPRWAYEGSVKCDNAFVIEETAGLQIETPKKSFYVDNNTTAAYTHIGLHSHSTVTVPKLKQGDFVRLNMSRVIPNNGAIIEAKNVTDLADKPVTEVFTISRSQIDYKENGMLATDDNGSRIIPGYYTFKVAADGDVSFTLADEGYLDVLSVEIYDKDVADTYLGTKADDGYQHTLTAVKSTDAGYPYAKTVVLKENDDTEEIGLAFCHPMWSTSTGPADYVLRGGPTTNLDADLTRDPWMSGGGVWYENGLITARQGYGKITVRMNNYTADRKYLIGYSPDYTVTVGHKPHQDYPYTWNFTNISGGEVKGDNNNVYNSVNGDTDTWTNRGSNVFELDTDTEGGSFYVPGATLVSTPRDLGMKGTKTTLDATGNGCDEFNGLGFNGQVLFKTESQAFSAREGAPRRTATPGAMVVSLLSYSMDDPNYTYGAELAAGNGTIMFGANKRETSNDATCGYIYRLDDGNTKYIKLMPMRDFQVGDVVKIKARNGDIKLCLIEEDKSASAIATFTCSNTEAEYTYTVTSSDGIVGNKYLCIYRNTTTTLISEVNITGSYTAPASKMLYVIAPTTITIPDLNADGKQDWIYIKASKKPSAITNATLVESGSDGPDANTGVYKYKVTAPGNSDVTFNGDTEIDQIGVTHILKQMTRAGDKAWATESRDHSIDHSLTGYFTLNDVNVHTVTKNNETTTAKRTVVKLNAIAEDGYVPGETGLVMRLDGLDNADKLTNYGKTNSYDSSNGTGRVPLFYPAMTTGQTITKVSFPSYNLMYPNLTEQELTSETENVGVTDYTRFILAKRYAIWKKENGSVVNPTGFESQEAAVFYRLHHFGGSFDGETAEQLNTLGPNKAYLLLPTSQLPAALWDANSPSRPYIAILGVSDMEEDFGSESADGFPPSEKTYNLRGQAIDADGALAPGIYIRNGKKIIIKR